MARCLSSSRWGRPRRGYVRGGRSGPDVQPERPRLAAALCRRWVLAVTLGILVGAAVGAGFWFFLPPGKHTAYVKLYMPSRPEHVLYDLDGTNFGSFQRTQLALLRGRMVLNAALANPKVRQLNLDAVRKKLSAVEWLEKEIKVDFPDGPELPRVTMTGDDPEQIKVLVTAVVDAYLEQVVNKEKLQRQQRIAQLKEILTDYEGRLKKVQDRRDELARAIGAGSDQVLVIKQELRERQLGLAQGELIRVEADLRRMEIEAKIYQGRDGTAVEVPDKLIDAYVDNDLKAEVAARTELEARLCAGPESPGRREQPNDPEVTQRHRTEEYPSRRAAEEVAPPVQSPTPGEGAERFQGQLALLNDQIKFNSELKDLLLKEVERLQGDTKKLTAGAINIDGFRVDLQQMEAGVSRVKAEIDKVTVELPAPPRVTQQEETIVIAPDESARKLKMAGMGTGIGFGAVVLLVSFLEFRIRRLDSADEVVQGLGLDLMEHLPAAPRRFGGRLIHSAASDTADWQALLAESVDSRGPCCCGRGARCAS